MINFTLKTTIKNKLLLIVCFVLCVSSISNSNAQTVTIANGTSNSYLYGPVYSYGTTAARSARYAYIYPASLLSSIADGSLINSLEFNRATDGPSFSPGTSYKIYLKNTSLNDWGATALDFNTAITGATLVYDTDPASAIGNTSGWKVFNFINPYVFSIGNGSNLAVIIEYVQPASTGTTTTINWIYDATAQIPAYLANQTKYSNNTSNATPPASLSSSSVNHPQIKINYSVPVACVAPPNAGVASTNKSKVCYSESFLLNVSGNSNGIGQTFQWQESTNNTSWSDISNATMLGYNTTQNVPTKYYRLVTTCSGQSDTSNAVQVNAFGPFSGVYTINKNQPESFTNFTSINDAIKTITCAGVSGPVTFRISSDTYNEQIILGPITGTSNTNRVRFVGNNSTIKFSTSVSADRHIVKFNDADYITLDSLTIEADDAGTHGYALQFLSGSSYNEIKNSVIKSSITSSSTNYAAISFSGSATSATTAGIDFNENLIENNTIIGGYYSVIIYGTTASATNSKGNKIINNKLIDAYSYGIYTLGVDSTIMSKNDIYRQNRTNTTSYYGIYNSTNSFRSKIDKNTIHDPFVSITNSSSAFYGIYINGSDSKEDELIVKNNIIYNANGTTGGRYGLYNLGSDSVSFYNNTVIFDDPNPSSGAINGFIHGSTGSTGSKLINNIIYINSAGSGNRIAEYWTNTTPLTTFTSNYNDLYVSSVGTGINAAAYYNSINYSFSDWVLAGNDLNSFSIDPTFVSGQTGMHVPSVVQLNDAGLSLTNVTDDITGAIRSNAPDIGAYEYSLSLYDISVNSFEMSNICTGIQGVFVRITNGGIVDLNTAEIHWKLNNVTQTAYNFNGILVPGEDTVLLVGQFNAQKDTAYTITAWSKSPNGSVDLNTTNDTIVSKVYKSGLNGVYLVGGQGANFNSLTSAAVELSNRGVCGPVILEYTTNNTTYLESVVLKDVPGVNIINTITINGKGNTISSNSLTNTERSVIRIENTDYVTIDSINISIPDTSVYGWGIHLYNGSDYTTIKNSNINVSKTNTTSTNHIGIVQSGSLTSATTSTSGAYNLIENNTISGGYHSIAMNGVTNNIASVYNQIIGNTIQDFYAYGIYANALDSANISQNDISRPNRTTTTTTGGIQLTGHSNSAIIQRNNIHDLFTSMPTSTSSAYGIYQTTNDANALRPVIVKNNLIHNIKSEGIIYGIYNSGSDNIKYYNNTVSIDDVNSNSSSVAYGFYQTTIATGIELKNNIFVVNRSGSGIRAAVRFNTTTSTIESNYNNYYTTDIGTGVNAIGYWGTVPSDTMSEWQSLNRDQNSFNLLPLFASVANGNLTPNAFLLDGSGIGLSQVTDDYFGVSRSSQPDLGAIEFSVILDDAGVTLLDSPKAFCPGVQVVKARIKNYGISTITNVNVNWSINGVLQTPLYFIGSIASSEDTSLVLGTSNFLNNVNYSIKVWTSSPNGSNDNVNDNDTLLVNNIRTSFAGTVSVGGINADYPTLNAVVNDINLYGVCDTLIINVDSAAGPYQEQVLLSNISTTAETRPIIINGNGAIINFEPTVSADRYIFRIQNTDYITINNFNIVSNTATNTYGIHVMSGSNYNTISNNKIKINSTSTSSVYAGIVFSNSTTSATTGGEFSNNKVINNHIDGGYYGIIIYGLSASSANNKNNEIINNVVLNNYSDGIYVINLNDIVIKYNEVARPTRTNSTSFNAIYLSTIGRSIRVNGNKIHSIFTAMPTSTSALYGIYITGSDLSGDKGIVSNNLIYNIGGGGSHYMMYNSSSDSILYAYNSLFNYDQVPGKSSLTYGFYQTTLANGIELYNNSIYLDRLTTGSQVGLYFSTSTTIPTSNYNNIYVPNGNIAYHSNLKASLTDWRNTNTTSPYDVNSTSVDPLYNSDVILIPQPISPLIGTALPLTQVLDDVNGSVRSLSNPNKGAYENSGDYRGPYFSVNPIQNTLSTTNYVVNGVVSVADYSGVDTNSLNRARIYYKKTTDDNEFVDNTSSTNGWKYSVANNATSPYNFEIDYSKLFGGTVSVNDEIEYFFVAQDVNSFVSSSTGIFKNNPSAVNSIDSNQFPISGTALKYRISTIITADTIYVGNSHTIANLTSNTGLFKYLNDNILGKDLTVIVTSDLAENGANALNQITEAGVGNYTVKIKPAGKTVFNIAGSYVGGLIRLYGADRIIIDGSVNDSGRYFNISNTSTATNTSTIQLIGLGVDTNGATHNVIKSCSLSTSTTSGNGVVIHIGGETIPYARSAGNHHNKIIGNRIIKGSVGIYNSGTSTSLSDSLMILNNIIGNTDDGASADNLRLYGIALEYTQNAVIEGNTIRNIKNTGAQQSWGIATYNTFKGGLISKNRIRNIVGGTGDKGGRGIELNSTNQNSDTRIFNNFIAGVSGNGSADVASTANVGLALKGSSGVKVYNNSIHLSGSISRTTATPDTSAGVLVSGNANHIEFINNTFSNLLNNTTDTSVAYAFLLKAADTSITTFDYNNFYVGANTQGVLARFSNTDVSTLNNIKTVTNSNVNSISISPNFISNTDLHAQGSSLYKKGQTLTEIVDDIDNEIRTTPPCIGADEFVAPLNDIVNAGVLYPTESNIVCGNSSDSVVFVIFNQGTQAQTGFNLISYISGAITDTLTQVYNKTLLSNQRDTVVLKYYSTMNVNGNINIETIVDLIGDSGKQNDSVSIVAVVKETPLAPTILATNVACVGESSMIVADGTNGNINWYNTELGGVSIESGDTLYTPNLFGPTTYYVSSNASTLVKVNTGMKQRLPSATSGLGTTHFGIVFDVLAPFTLESVVVYPVASSAGVSGTVTIDVTDGNGVILHSKVVNVIGNPSANATPQRVTLDFPMQTGTNYKIRPGVRGAGITGLLFEPSASAPSGNYGYPYVVPGLLSIRTSTLTAAPTNTARNDLYYYFYDWIIKTGQDGCESDRTPITITPKPLPSGSEFLASSPFNGTYNTQNSSPDLVCINDTVTYKISTPNGFNEVDLGTTWTINNFEIKTPAGLTPNGVVSINGASIMFVPNVSDQDTVFKISASIKSITSNCDTQIVRFVKAVSLPIVNLGSDKSICEGDSVELSAGLSGTLSYNWSTGDTTSVIKVADAGVYILEVTNESGCSSRDTISVNVISNPVVNLGQDIEICEGDQVIIDASIPNASYLWSTGATTQTITVNTSGVYSVQVTVGSSCSSSDTISVTVNPNPIVDLGLDKDICGNEVVVLDAGNPNSTYLWSTGATTQTISVSNAGTYWVVVTSQSGCSDSDTVSVSNKNTPVANFTFEPLNGLNVQFNAITESNTQYEWNFGDPASGGLNTSLIPAPIHEFTSAGTYVVRLKATNATTGCITIKDSTINVSFVGVESNTADRFNFFAAPNPYAGSTNLNFTLTSDAKVSIEMYDVLGRKVKDVLSTTDMNAGTHKVELNNNQELPSGIYLIRLNVNGIQSIIRVQDNSK